MLTGYQKSYDAWVSILFHPLSKQLNCIPNQENNHDTDSSRLAKDTSNW